MRRVAVLFAREDSHYKTMPECDVWDVKRDARKWPGGAPIVAHPPCRAWGRLRKFAKPRPDEAGLALWAAVMVQMHGGVLEHPAESTLWQVMSLPRPGDLSDEFGGYTIEVRQCDHGHRAEKLTWLYIVRGEPGSPPPRREPTGVIRPKQHAPHLPIVTHREREATPPPFAQYLVAIALGCK